MSEELAIRARGLAKSFGSRRAVDNLSIDVPVGTIYGFLGPNGSGKTTSIRMLCGLLTPDAGEGTCLGYDLRRDTARIKRNVGYMPQRFGLYEDLTIRENLEFVARIYEMPDARRTAAEAIERLGLGDREGQLAGTLSGGWKQRLALASCILHKPRLLLLDEPTAGVDPRARREFWDEIHILANAGITVLVSTHYMDEAERCSHVGYVYFSKLLVSGRPDELKGLPEVTPAGLRWLGVESREAGRALAVMRGIEGVRRPTIFGQTVRARVDDAVPVEHIEQALTRGGIADARVRLVQPSLEDVFVTFTQREGGGAP
jgi:ABC-2 type transport system ATP-binding protein